MKQVQLITGFILSIIVIFLIVITTINDKTIKASKQNRELKVGQLWGNNIDHNPFEQDTITILAIKNGFVQYQIKSTKIKESCPVTDFLASDLYLITNPLP